jgi:hypothetical protein
MNHNLSMVGMPDSSWRAFSAAYLLPGQQMADLVEITSELIRTAALSLGLSAEDARLAGRSALFSAGDKLIAILPIGRFGADHVQLMLSIQSDQLVLGEEGPQRTVAVLQHVPGALHAFSAALGATPEGFWTLFRTVRVGVDDGPGLARHAVETLRLAEFVLQVADEPEH